MVIQNMLAGASLFCAFGIFACILVNPRNPKTPAYVWAVHAAFSTVCVLVSGVSWSELAIALFSPFGFLGLICLAFLFICE